MDNFITLSNRVLNRCPAAGLALSQQFVNDAWRTLQARKEWSWRRRSNTFAPPNLYSTGFATTNSAAGNPTLVTGVGTTWTPQMIGTQIRIGGLLYPFYTISGWLSATQIFIDQPWAGMDVTSEAYTIQQNYYPMPTDFGYFYAVVSVKDGYRLWTSLTQADLALMDPQRTNFGQTYAIAFRDYSPIYQGVIYPTTPLGAYASNPISTTTLGFSYPIAATYLIQISGSGLTGTATYVWTRIGQTAGFGAPVTTQTYPLDLSDGVQVYWPAGATWTSGNSWIINAQPVATSGVPRYELWPAPTYSAYLYPYQYIAKEYDLTPQQPQLPPFIANRGEVLLEMALEKCAEFPGADADHRNIYHDLRQAQYHANKVKDMLIDLERNDEEVAVNNIDYQMWPAYPAPWFTGQWQQTHAPFLD
jgi:hypothetical protein